MPRSKAPVQIAELSGLPSNPPAGSLSLYFRSGVARQLTSGGVETPLSYAYPTGMVTLTDAATIATDASLGDKFRVTLGGNRTLGNPTSVTNGQDLTFFLKQDGTGGRTITLGNKFLLGTDVTNITLSTGANVIDVLKCVYLSTEDKFLVTGFVRGYA